MEIVQGLRKLAVRFVSRVGRIRVPTVFVVVLVVVLVVVAALSTVLIRILSGSPADTAGRTYYVSPEGDDRASGRSPRRAWSSLRRASDATLRPGDRLLLEGGATFTEMLTLDAPDAGRPDAPVLVGSYGIGRARITPHGESGVSVVNTAGVEIRDLVLVGDRAAYHETPGITLFADSPRAVKHEHIVVENVDVSGFSNGVSIGGAGGAGFRGVRVSHAVLHDNMESGLVSYGPPFDVRRPSFAHEQIKVSGVRAYRNLGDPRNLTDNTGSGIVLGSIDGGVVEKSSAHDNGVRCPAPEGPFGIWAYDARRVVIRQNVSYRNHTASTADGGGFDLDQNVSSSVLERNLSYGNDGPGYLAFSGVKNGAMGRNVIRFNISSEDGRRSSRYGGITLAGSISNIEVYNNTVVTVGDGSSQPSALVLGPGLSGVAVRNNILRADVAGAVVTAAALSTDQVLLQGNDYIDEVAPLTIWWGGETYTTLSRWRAESGQEKVGGVDVGMIADPWADRPRVVGNPETTDAADVAAAFMVTPDSPVAGNGLDISRFGVDAGETDFWSAPLAGRRPSVGAHQPTELGFDEGSPREDSRRARAGSPAGRRRL